MIQRAFSVTLLFFLVGLVSSQEVIPEDETWEETNEWLDEDNDEFLEDEEYNEWDDEYIDWTEYAELGPDGKLNFDEVAEFMEKEKENMDADEAREWFEDHAILIDWDDFDDWSNEVIDE